MESEENRFIEQGILAKIRRLGPQQIAEVEDFIDFLAERKNKRSPLMQIINETPDRLSELEDVRKRLSKIPGKMSDTVRELRNERG